MEEKNKIRKDILNKRRKITEDFVEKSSNIIMGILCKIIDDNSFNNIMIFMDMKNEVKITKLLNIYPKKNFYIPKTLENGNMKINKYSKGALVLHKFGYYESFSHDYIEETVLDLIIIPGVAFDKNRNRIGFGGGYYDRFLQKLKENHNRHNTRFPLTAAVCYDFQLLESIPSEEHDIKPKMIITENQVLKG